MVPYFERKDHVSFSEFKNWIDCTFRHWLLYVMNLREEDEDTIFTIFGTIVHEASEGFLKTKVMEVDKAVDILTKLWEEQKYPNVEGWPGYADPNLKYWQDNLREILSAIPAFVEETFPGWEFVDAEHELSEMFDPDRSLKFNGYIDAILKVKDKRGNEIFWVLDWKTATKRGWGRDKTWNFYVMMQVILYKHFWATKTGRDPKRVRCGYVILKRDVQKNRCSLLTVSSGPKATTKALTWVRSMIKMVSDGRRVKNRNSCKFCQFKDTPHCKLNL